MRSDRTSPASGLRSSALVLAFSNLLDADDDVIKLYISSPVSKTWPNSFYFYYFFNVNFHLSKEGQTHPGYFANIFMVEWCSHRNFMHLPRIHSWILMLKFGRMVMTTIFPSFGDRDLGIDIRFTSFQELNVEFTYNTIGGHRSFSLLLFS